MKFCGFSFNSDFVPIHRDKLNNEYKWWPSDTKENYDPVNNAYGPEDITYKLNSNGFRCDEFDIPCKNGILFLGCSFTKGIGLPLEHTWAYILLDLIKKETNQDIPFWNLSFGGSGLDFQTRVYYHYGLKLKPKLVFAYLPVYRRELYNDSDAYPSFCLPNSNKFNFNKFPYLIDNRIITYETEKNMCFLDCMLKLNDTVMIWNSYDKNYYDSSSHIQLKHNYQLLNDNKARDKKHAGYATNLTFAKTIFENYKDIIIDKLKD